MAQKPPPYREHLRQKLTGLQNGSESKLWQNENYANNTHHSSFSVRHFILYNSLFLMQNKDDEMLYVI